MLAAGSDSSFGTRVKSVWSDELPDRWVVITRDVFGDFGSCELEGITLSTGGTGSLLFDHVYFARRQSDFDLISPE